MNEADMYKPRQLDEVAPLLGFVPEWFIDCGVGANGGEAFAARRLWPDCKIIGFEPNPNAFRAMQPHYPGDLLQQAVWLRTAILPIHSSQTDLQANFFIPEGETTLVYTTTLDAVDAYHRGPFRKAFLWMDVEHAEVAVLIGARKLLERGAILAVNFENHSHVACPSKSLIVRELLTWHGFQHAKTYVVEGEHHWDELWLLREGGS
jgi:FkbM family methyltransferase